MKDSSIQNYLSGLNYYLKQRGAREIDYESCMVKATLKGIRRVNGGMLRRDRPLLSHSTGHTEWRAAVLVFFRALLRKTQVKASDAMLRRWDFKFYDWGIVIEIRKKE